MFSFGLWWFERTSQNADFSVFDFFLHGGVGEVFINNDTLNELGVFDRATSFSDDFDEVEVHIFTFEVSNV